MTNARYRRKQLAKREGWPASATPPGPTDAPGAGSDSNAAAESAVVQPNAPAAPAREER